MDFIYEARNNKGERISGIVQADSKEEAELLVEEQGYTVIDVTTERRRKKLGMHIFERIQLRDLVTFYRELSMMISADVPIVQALQIITAQTQNEKFKKVLSQVYGDVNEGMKFSDALSEHKHVFQDFYTYMIRSGEASGKIDTVLEYLADSQEKEFAFRSKIRGAMIYPIFIFSAMIILGMLMMIFVIPSLTLMLSESGIELPLSTRILIGASDFSKQYWYVLVIGAVIIFGGLRLFITRTVIGKKLLYSVLMHLPKFGDQLIKKTYLVRLTKSMALLLTGGVPLTECLAITGSVVGNIYYKELLDETTEEVKDGNTIISVFSEYPELIPSMLAQMIAIGEQTGKLDQVFDKVGNFYTKEVDIMVENISKLIEPIIILLIGGAVGFLVVSIMIPMFKVSQAI